MSLSIDCRVPERDVQVQLQVPSGSTVALVGPNGAGKSTVLGLLAGLVRPSEGHIRLGDRYLVAAGVPGLPDVFVPPHRRRVALMAQDPLLFPQMTALENVAFGPRSAGVSRARARAAAGRWLSQVGIPDLGDLRPGQLSGGQSQRVALARALATEPDLLLLDEPLAALDVDAAASLRPVLAHLLAGLTAVVVTHDVLDAVLLADRIAVLEAGQVVESGPTEAILRGPRSGFGARFSGLNLIRGTVQGRDCLRTAESLVVHGQAEGRLPVGGPAVAVFSPAAVAVHTEPPSGSPRNVFPAVVTSVQPVAHLVRVTAAGLSADITPESVARLRVAVGSRIHLVVKAAEVRLYPADDSPAPGTGEGPHL